MLLYDSTKPKIFKYLKFLLITPNIL